MNSPEEPLWLLSTSTDQVCAAVVKMGLTTIWLPLNELIARLVTTCPCVLSRNVTVSPDTTPLPLMKNGCGLADPVTGLGDTELIAGPATLNENTLEVPPSGLLTRMV